MQPQTVYILEYAASVHTVFSILPTKEVIEVVLQLPISDQAYTELISEGSTAVLPPDTSLGVRTRLYGMKVIQVQQLVVRTPDSKWALYEQEGDTERTIKYFDFKPGTLRVMKAIGLQEPQPYSSFQKADAIIKGATSVFDNKGYWLTELSKQKPEPGDERAYQGDLGQADSLTSENASPGTEPLQPGVGGSSFTAQFSSVEPNSRTPWQECAYKHLVDAWTYMHMLHKPGYVYKAQAHISAAKEAMHNRWTLYAVVISNNEINRYDEEWHESICK